MKFEIIEDVVKLGYQGYIRHKLEKMKEGEFIQKCVYCNEIIIDKTPNPNVISSRLKIVDGKWVKDDDVSIRGAAPGIIYISVQQNPKTMLQEWLIERGYKMPTDFIDCRTVNS